MGLSYGTHGVARMKFLRAYELFAALVLGVCASKSSNVANVVDDRVNETNRSNTVVFDYRSFVSILRDRSC